MKLGLISAKYPYGDKEPYLDAELRALAPSLAGLEIFPVSPETRRTGFANPPGTVSRLPLAGARTFALAAASCRRHPFRVLGALAALFFDRYPLRIKLKNAAVVPKGLAVAELARNGGVDHLHAYWLSTPATVAWLASRVAGIPFSATAHRWDIYENNLLRRKLRDAAFVRTISERGRRDLLARTGADPSRVVVIRLGVALEPASDRVPAPERAPLRILCAAALVPVKGHAVLIGALARLRDAAIDFECTFAGDGPLRASLERAIAAAGLQERVRFAGSIPHDALLAQLARGDYDVSVLASVEREGGLMEGLPVALIEAMAAGTAVVATDSGSISELVDGSTGLLVPQSDPAALAAALTRVVREAGLRERLQASARERVAAEFDLARTSIAFRELLTSV